MREAVRARKNGIHLIVIGVGRSVRQTELQGIASDPDDVNLFGVRDFNALLSIKTQLTSTICNGTSQLLVLLTPHHGGLTSDVPSLQHCVHCDASSL